MAVLDGFVFITAEHNHAPSGALKNAIDYLYPELERRPAGFIGYKGAGGARAVEQVRLILVELRVPLLRDAVYIALADLLQLRGGASIADIPYWVSSGETMLNHLA